jgi:hypothetical protein
MGPTGTGKSQVRPRRFMLKLRTVSTDSEYSLKRLSIHSLVKKDGGLETDSFPSPKVSRLLVFWTTSDTDPASFL